MSVVLLHVPFPDVVGESSNLGTLAHKKNNLSFASKFKAHASWPYDSSFLVGCKSNTCNQDKK